MRFRRTPNPMRIRRMNTQARTPQPTIMMIISAKKLYAIRIASRIMAQTRNAKLYGLIAASFP